MNETRICLIVISVVVLFIFSSCKDSNNKIEEAPKDGNSSSVNISNSLDMRKIILDQAIEKRIIQIDLALEGTAREVFKKIFTEASQITQAQYSEAIAKWDVAGMSAEYYYNLANVILTYLEVGENKLVTLSTVISTLGSPSSLVQYKADDEASDSFDMPETCIFYEKQLIEINFASNGYILSVNIRNKNGVSSGKGMAYWPIDLLNIGKLPLYSGMLSDSDRKAVCDCTFNYLMNKKEYSGISQDNKIILVDTVTKDIVKVYYFSTEKKMYYSIWLMHIKDWQLVTSQTAIENM